jgi:hypothetical protein
MALIVFLPAHSPHAGIVGHERYIPANPICILNRVRAQLSAYRVSSPFSYGSDFHGGIQDNHPAERHSEEFRCLRTVLLHLRKQATLQASQPGQRTSAYNVPAHEE